MDEAAEAKDPRDTIWEGDLLGRRDEADTIQAYIEHESAIFLEQQREQSLVLAIDAEYGQGKSWFLDKLAEQLALTHPVARIDAWADDASEEPLTAFMASIDDALAPYLTKSSKLRDKMAAAKVAALPVMGRLVKGAMVKGLSKVAGDSAEDALGEAFEDAVQDARETKDDDADGAISDAVEGAFEEVGKEIDSLVDRRGAAMLAEYRRRKKSREGFRQNMRELVAGIDAAEVEGTTPLVVIIDELDRCRPDYAIRVLEEIKHFFDVPGVVFVLAIHEDQLRASIAAVYGACFDAGHYLRRFFTRRWNLRPLTITELVIAEWEKWDDEAKRFEGAAILLDGIETWQDAPVLLGNIFEPMNVSAREARAVLDVLRLMAIGWDQEAPISILVAGPMAVNFVRSEDLRSLKGLTSAKFSLPSDKRVSDFGYDKQAVDLSKVLSAIWLYEHYLLRSVGERKRDHDAVENYVTNFFEAELSARAAKCGHDVGRDRSLISTYEDRLTHIAGFLER